MLDYFLLVLLIFLPSIYFLRIYTKWKRFADQINKIPGPKSYPIIGCTWEFLTATRQDIFNVFRQRSQKYKPFYRNWMSGTRPEIHVMKAEHLEIIMGSSKHSEKGIGYRFLEPWLGLGLLTNKGPQWHSRRKMITPTFHFKILESFFDIIADKSLKLNDQLKTKAGGKAFDIYPFITHCALDIICETAMGVEVNAMNQSNSDYVAAIYEISELVIQRSFKPWLHTDFVFFNLSKIGRRFQKCLDIVHGFTIKVIKERKQNFEQKIIKPEGKEIDFGGKKRLAFLDLLIQASADNGTQLSDADIREEVDTFMFEGHDTTTAGICWSLFLLGNYPDIQRKVYEELQQIFDDDRAIRYEDLGQMKYLECVIKESLRLYPSVPFITRTLTEDTEINGFLIPAGVTSILHIFEVHRDPEHFPNPNVFDPDNFLPERCQHRHPYAYIPFSAGPRNCIGQKFALMEEKILLATVLRKFRVESMEKVEDINMFAELILRPQNGVLLKLYPR